MLVMHLLPHPLTLSALACAHASVLHAVVTIDGVDHTAGILLEATVAVPALNIPRSTISVVVTSADGELASAVELKVGSHQLLQ